jgi:Phosphodiester glycosidase
MPSMLFASRVWIAAVCFCACGALVFFCGAVPTSFAQGSHSPIQAVSLAPGAGWHSLEAGLDLGEFTAPSPSAAGDSRITVVRIDPARFKLMLLSVVDLALPSPLGIDSWTTRYHLSAAINGGMFERDHRTTTGYARIGKTTVNPTWKPTYQAFLALGPDNGRLPAAAILDPECDDVRGLERHYHAVLQSIRMVDCKGRNRWTKELRAWSTAALAVDGARRLLFIHARSPWPVHDLVENLLALPLGIERAMYLEGGPEAGLALASASKSFVQVGSFETGFNENDDNHASWPLPNVIGARRATAKGN